MLKCSKCKRVTYNTTRNKKSAKKPHLKDKKLDLSKYCKFCRVRTPHKEGKK